MGKTVYVNKYSNGEIVELEFINVSNKDYTKYIEGHNLSEEEQYRFIDYLSNNYECYCTDTPIEKFVDSELEGTYSLLWIN